MINPVPDKALHQKLTQRLGRTGTGSQSRISIQVLRGDVTLSGTLQYEMQRRPIVRAATSVQGVRCVRDQMQVEVKQRKWS